MKRLQLPLLIACLTLAACSTASKPQIERQILIQTSHSWDGNAYTAYPEGRPELTLLKLRIPANTVLDWHTHPMPNLAYILSGELLVQAQASGHQRILKAGHTLAEMVDTVHRGKTGDSPVELIVFYAGSPGIHLSQAQ